MRSWIQTPILYYEFLHYPKGVRQWPWYQITWKAGGDQLSDWTAPTAALTSSDIIADSYYTFPILSGIYKNGRALAKVGVMQKKQDRAFIKSYLHFAVQPRMLEELYELIKTLSKTTQ